MRRLLAAVIHDPRVVSAALASLLIPVDIGNGQVPWQYNTLCDWTTTTLLSVACGQTLAACVVRRNDQKWWFGFGGLLLLHLTGWLYWTLVTITMEAGGFLLPGLMGASSGILGLLFLGVLLAFVAYHGVLARSTRPDLPVWGWLLRGVAGLALSYVLLVLCARFAPGRSHLLGGADTVLYFGARAIIPYCFWSCVRPRVQPLPNPAIQTPQDV